MYVLYGTHQHNQPYSDILTKKPQSVSKLQSLNHVTENCRNQFIFYLTGDYDSHTKRNVEL